METWNQPELGLWSIQQNTLILEESCTSAEAVTAKKMVIKNLPESEQS